jgi:hypothetical protein
VGDVESYRALKYNWVGQPKNEPSLAVFREGSRGVAAYVSWNGATEVKTWELLASTDSSGSNAFSIRKQNRTGFETAITVSDKDGYAYFSVQARDTSGRILGQSSFKAAS